MQKSAAGKGDETNTVTLKFIDQVLANKLNAFEPVRLDVIGKHAARSIDRDEQVEAFPFHILKRITPARLRETDKGQGKTEQLQSESHHASRAIYRSRELRQQPC